MVYILVNSFGQEIKLIIIGEKSDVRVVIDIFAVSGSVQLCAGNLQELLQQLPQFTTRSRGRNKSKLNSADTVKCRTIYYSIVRIMAHAMIELISLYNAYEDTYL